METNQCGAAACGQYPASGCWSVWMPIETAPKDREIIVAFKLDDTDEYIVKSAVWNTGYGGDLETAPWEPTFVTLEGADMINPDFWIPFPNPPTPSHHDGAAPAPSVDGVVGTPNLNK